MSLLFDTYLAVDWSARGKPSPAKPSKDSVWVGEAASGMASPQEHYFRTRQACQAYLRERLASHLEAKRRVFLGFDFAYGYPAGYAQALGLRGPAEPWRRTWAELSRLIQDEDNLSNRFEVAAALNARCGSEAGPLWGCPSTREGPSLKATSPGFPYPVSTEQTLPRLRLTDQRERRAQPVWKLYGNGSVGSQVLVGVPVVTNLRDDPRFSPVSRVWPFETGFTALPTPTEGPFILHAEIWPGIVPALDEIAIRDQAQVRAVVKLLARLDQEGKLGRLFDRPSGLADDDERKVVAEEGWISGAGMSFG